MLYLSIYLSILTPSPAALPPLGSFRHFPAMLMWTSSPPLPDCFIVWQNRPCAVAILRSTPPLQSRHSTAQSHGSGAGGYILHNATGWEDQ